MTNRLASSHKESPSPLTFPSTPSAPATVLSVFESADAEEVADFLNDLRLRHWALTSSAYQRKPNSMPLVSRASLLEEQKQHLHRIGYYILRHRGNIIATMKIDDRYGDGRVAVVSDLETHPDFQRRGYPWFYLLPCVRKVIEDGYWRVELTTWAFNRKGLPLYKRCGFRGVPGTSLLMENYLAVALYHPALQPYFRRHDYIKTLVNERSYGFDAIDYCGLQVFQYKWRAAGEEWEVLINRDGGQVVSVRCARWSFDAWVTGSGKVHIGVKNHQEAKVTCSLSGRIVVDVSAGKEQEVELEGAVAGIPGGQYAELEVEAGQFRFPFSLQKMCAE